MNVDAHSNHGSLDASEEVLGVPHPQTQRLLDILNDRIGFDIPIKGDRGLVIGRLAPLTRRQIDNPELIRTFVRWRNRYRLGWLDQRPVTEAGTYDWARHAVDDPSRMVLLIYAGDRLIGRCGYLRLTAVDNESDGLVRGERGGGILFMHYAQIAGLEWQFGDLGLQSVLSKVISSNENALESCRRLGYDMSPERVASLFRHPYPTGDLLKEIGSCEQLIHGERVVYLRLRRDDFFRSLSTAM